MLVFSDSENGGTQESFLKRMHARVVLETDARHQKGNFDVEITVKITFLVRQN